MAPSPAKSWSAPSTSPNAAGNQGQSSAPGFPGRLRTPGGVWGALRGPPCSTGETAKGDPLVIRPLVPARQRSIVRMATRRAAVRRSGSVSARARSTRAMRRAGDIGGADADGRGIGTTGAARPTGAARAPATRRTPAGQSSSRTPRVRHPRAVSAPSTSVTSSPGNQPTTTPLKRRRASAAKKIRSGGGQDDPEHGAALVPVRRGDAAAEALDDARRDREAEPGGGFLGREERLEDAGQDRAGDPGSTVAHLEDAAERIGRGGHGDLAAAVPVAQLV